MTFATALRELWSKRIIVAVGVVVAAGAAALSVSNVSLLPPKLGEGTLEYHSGRTQIMVDSSRSSLADLTRDFTPMVARANVYSRFMTTPDALRFIGEHAGIPPQEIYAEGPYQLGQARYIQEPTAERSGDQLVGLGARYRLRFDSDPELPIVTVYAEAPTAQAATDLAQGAATGLASYVEGVQDRQQIPERRRVAIRQLGSTTAEPVTPGANRKIAAFVFFVVLGLWCLALLGVRRVRDAWNASTDGGGLRDQDSEADAYAPHVKAGRVNGEQTPAQQQSLAEMLLVGVDRPVERPPRRPPTRR